MGIKNYLGRIYNGAEFNATQDCISIEVPLSISINNIPFTVTMQTPGNEIELARGLLFTENIFKDLEYVPSFEVLSKNEDEHITALNFNIPQELILKDFEGKRNVISASSCGVCGKTEFEEQSGLCVDNSMKIKRNLIQKLFEQLNDGQDNFKKSGGTHAACAFTIDGELLTLQEDIGRHNAVDKVIGFLLINKLLAKAKCVNVSGRISFEIVEKAKIANIPFLASVSAPSSLAIDNAQASGITLIAFCRNEKYTVYSNYEQIESEND